MQRLTYPRTINVPLVPSVRAAIMAFYQSSPRLWKLDDASSSVFRMKFFRGNWGVSKTAGWLGKMGLSKFARGRQAQSPSVEGGRVSFESWPAELTVTMKPADGVFELLMVYEVTMLGGVQTMSRDDKKKWKVAVEEDAYDLGARLQGLNKLN